MISPEHVQMSSTCHLSDWRGMRDSSPHPVRYVFLSYDEIDELLETGSFTLPGYLIPESVRKWRQRQEIIAEINAIPEPKMGRFSEIDEFGNPVGEPFPIVVGTSRV